MRDSCRPQYDSFQMHEFGDILGIEHSYVRTLVDKHPDDSDDPEQSLVEIIHHWLQKHPKPNWSRLEIAMNQILEYRSLFHRPHSAGHHALQTLRKEYEG